jgi:hypothetical protein
MAFKAGDRVILGYHDKMINGRLEFWSSTMDRYAGQTATLIECAGKDYTGNYWYVDVDKNHHYWREANMRSAVFNKDQVCSLCKVSCPHEAINQNYICVACRTMKELE